MAFSQNDVDTLKAAIASGVMLVKFADGRHVQYQSGADLRAALALAEAEVANAGGSRSSSTVTSFCRD